MQAQFPDAALVPAASSAAAAEFARSEHDAGRRGVAALGSRLAAQRYGLDLLFESVEDDPHNLTRFFVLSRDAAPASGEDKTSVMFRTSHAPGALVRILSIFADAGLNLTHIDKRPSGRENWQYTFFIDAEGHRDDQVLSDAIGSASAHCRDLTVLGSYPRSRRIL